MLACLLLSNKETMVSVTQSVFHSATKQISTLRTGKWEHAISFLKRHSVQSSHTSPSFTVTMLRGLYYMFFMGLHIHIGVTDVVVALKY